MGRRGLRRSRLAWGLALAASYVMAVALTLGGVPSRILFDGFVPTQPYRWVSPPPQFAATNRPPESGRGDIELTDAGSGGINVVTGDNQASVVAPQGAFPPMKGQTAVHLTIRPLDPATVAPPPAGMVFDGNAYTLSATYQPSGDEAPTGMRSSILLRYAIHSTVILRWTGSGWVELTTTVVSGQLQVFAGSESLGIFVPAGPATKGRGLGLLPYISVGAVALAGLAGLAVRWRERRRAQRSRRSRGTRGKAQTRRPDRR